jgi:hypothetical protein
MMQPTIPPKTAPAGPAKRPSRIGVVRFSAAQFLVALILLFVSAPFVAMAKDGGLIESVLMTFVMLSGAMAVGWRRRTLIIAGLLVVPAVAGKWIDHFQPDAIPPAVSQVCGLIFVIFVTAKLLQFVLRAPQVTSEVLCAGISGYLLLGLMWSFAYMMVSRAFPDSAFAFNSIPVKIPMTPFDAFYFSFITLSTVGYGDVTPLFHGARTLAAAEAITGTLYVAVLIARLVALYSTQPPPADCRPASESDNPPIDT